MSALPLSTFYNMIAPWAKKCPIPAMDNAIREAARDFCLQSKYRRVPTDPIDVNALQADYDLVAGNADEEVVLVQAAQYSDGNGFSWPLAPVQPEQAGSSYPPTSGRTPQAFWFTPDATISLWPIPQTSVAGGLIVQCILQPTLDAATIDSSIIRQHDTTIAWGALSRLLRRNGEPYSNMETALIFERDYKAGVAKAMTDAGFGFQQWNQTTAIYRY